MGNRMLCLALSATTYTVLMLTKHDVVCIVRWCMRLVLQVVAYVQKFGTKQWARIAQVQHFLKNIIAYPRCSKFSTYCSLLCVLALVITAFRSNT